MDERNHTSEFVHLGSTFGLLAVHGGGIEPGTEEIVRFVAHHSEASLYVYAGRRPAGNLSLHQPSHGTGLGSRPLVLRFLDHVKTAVSIHGHGRMQECAYVGGLHQTMYSVLSRFPDRNCHSTNGFPIQRSFLRELEVEIPTI